MSSITLYGSVHAEDNLLYAHRDIFFKAQADNCTQCFVEANPIQQTTMNEVVHKFQLSGVSQKEKFDETFTGLVKRYETAAAMDREDLAYEAKYVLSAHTGVQLVCADAAPRLAIIPVVKSAHYLREKRGMRDLPLQEAFDRFDFAEFALTEGYSLEDIKNIREQIKEEITDRTIVASYAIELFKRIKSDKLIADFIISKIDAAPAIGIFGAIHLDTHRKTSLTNTLKDKSGRNVETRYIDNGAIRRSPTFAMRMRSMQTRIALNFV